jgi:hypothetical protein
MKSRYVLMPASSLQTSAETSKRENVYRNVLVAKAYSLRFTVSYYLSADFDFSHD